MAGGPSIPDPNQAAIAGVKQNVSNFPFEYIINALSQMGGSGTVNGQSYNFSGLGNADVQNQLSDQMAQTLLDIQNGLGPQYIAQRLADLQQADPQGYAARQQLFDQIQQDANNPAPNLQLSQSTQNAILQELNKGASLDPQELTDVQQGVRGQQLSRGLYLGNAATQQEADAAVNAGDQLQQQRQQAAGSFLQSGVSPSDIQYRQIQQDLANLGAFLNNQTPTAQFGSLSGAQQQAAPTPNTGYQAASIDPNAAAQGISNSYSLYNIANSQANPYLAGLSTGISGLNTGFNLGWSPWNTSTSTPSPNYGPQTLPGWNPSDYNANDVAPTYP